MYLLCYGRSGKARLTGDRLMEKIPGRWISSTDFYSSGIEIPESKTDGAIVLLLPLEAACGILTSAISGRMSDLPVICCSPEGSFASVLRYGNMRPARANELVKQIASVFGPSCFTSFGSRAGIVTSLTYCIARYSMSVSDTKLANDINDHIISGGRVNIYTDIPLSLAEPVLDSMVYKINAFPSEARSQFMKAFIECESDSSSEPSVFITCSKMPEAENARNLILTPSLVCVGVELKAKVDPQYAVDIVTTSLTNHGIDPKAVSTIAVSQSARDSEVIKYIASSFGASVTAFSTKQISEVKLPLEPSFAPEKISDGATAAAYLAGTSGKILLRRGGGSSGVCFSAVRTNGHLMLTE
ncbi:MAG: cobalamin biosynthesis protein [Saccharofermentans sp.]|nr:cobalamin biosynthesis protein [Saccharofermentans sp.]